MILQLEIFHKSGKGRLSYQFYPKKRPRDVSLRPLPPPRETLSSKLIGSDRGLDRQCPG